MRLRESQVRPASWGSARRGDIVWIPAGKFNGDVMVRGPYIVERPSEGVLRLAVEGCESLFQHLGMLFSDFLGVARREELKRRLHAAAGTWDVNACDQGQRDTTDAGFDHILLREGFAYGHSTVVWRKRLHQLDDPTLQDTYRFPGTDFVIAVYPTGGYQIPLSHVGYESHRLGSGRRHEIGFSLSSLETYLARKVKRLRQDAVGA